MAYILGQYNYISGQPVEFMTTLDNSNFEVRRRPEENQEQEADGVFHDECLFYSNIFQTNTYYYFHGKIKRLSNTQTFYVKLVNYDEVGDEATEQYIKTIIVNGSNKENEWVDIEFLFAPSMEFNTLLFELVRTTEDWRSGIRYPKIIYEEVSIINNITTSILNASSLLKIGVQSRPGFLMCINGEEIRTCRTGIYELKNGTMMVNFFSAIAAASETTTDVKDAMAMIDAAVAEAMLIEDIDERQAAMQAIHSVALLNNKGTRTIDNFTIDYMYRTVD